jgi:fructokinase
MKIVTASGGLVSLDVNYRPTLWTSADAAYDAVMAIISQVDLLKVNGEELKLLTGESDPAVGGMALTKMGPKLSVMTSGTEGSYFASSEGTGFVPAFPVETVDATGCGDSFVAGLLSQLTAVDLQSALPSAEQMRQIVRYANAAGALTAQSRGVIPALPNADDVDHFLASHHS